MVGEAKSADGFTFLAVEAAGHMVPLNQPQVVSGVVFVVVISLVHEMQC